MGRRRFGGRAVDRSIRLRLCGWERCRRRTIRDRAWVKYDRVYRSLVEAVNGGHLGEPFGQAGFRQACQGFADGTYRAFLWKHSGGGGGSSGSKDQSSSKELRQGDSG